MARDWRRLAFAIVAAAAVGFACATSGAAQEPAKSPTKKTKAKAKAPEGEEAEEGEEGAAKTAPKKKRQDPAEAQRAIEAALKLIEAGKAEPATQALSSVIAGGNLPPAMMAKALFYRGVAYRQQKMPAQAIADLTSALWLKGGLGGNDRADAMRQRTSAYQEAGLAESGEPLAPATVPNAPRAPTRTASVEQGWGSEASPSAPATKQSGSGWNPFAGWFGGSSSPSASPSASPPPPQPTPTPRATASIDPSEPSSATPPGRPRTSAWTRNTEVHTSNPPPAAVVSPPPAAVVSPPPAAVASPAPAAKPEGRFRIQVGMVRTEHEAQALAAKVRRDYAAALAAREPEIDEAVVGNMGSFYRVRVGPFASHADGHAACAKLKGSGLDCLVVAQ
jgi:SPOR domain